MDIRQALDVLIREGSSPAEERCCPWLTRLRIALGLREALGPARRTEGAAISEPSYNGTRNSVSYRLEKVAGADAAATLEASAREWKSLQHPIALLTKTAEQHLPAALVTAIDLDRACRPEDRGTEAFDWRTDVLIMPDGGTKVSSFVEMPGGSFPRLAQLCDPQRWADGSMFWYESSRLDRDGRREPRPAPLPPGEAPQSWSGQLIEVVASTVAVFTAVLDIDFQVEDDSCLVEYHLVDSPSGLTKDEGYAYVTKVGEDRYRTQLVKWVDFRNAPFGGPSVLDQFLPSYIGSWLRVQQDLWAGEALSAV